MAEFITGRRTRTNEKQKPRRQGRGRTAREEEGEQKRDGERERHRGKATRRETAVTMDIGMKTTYGYKQARQTSRRIDTLPQRNRVSGSQDDQPEIRENVPAIQQGSTIRKTWIEKRAVNNQ